MKIRIFACLAFSCVLISAAQSQETSIDHETGLVVLEDIQVNSHVKIIRMTPEPEELGFKRISAEPLLREAVRLTEIEQQRLLSEFSRYGPERFDSSEYERNQMEKLRHFSWKTSSAGSKIGKIGRQAATELASSTLSAKLGRASARAMRTFARSLGKTSAALGTSLAKVAKSPLAVPALGLSISVVSDLALAEVQETAVQKPPMENVRQVGISLITGSLSAGTTLAVTAASKKPVFGFVAGVAMSMTARPFVDRKTKEIGEGIGNIAWRASRWTRRDE